MYTVFVRFYFGEKSATVGRLKQIEIVIQDSSKSTGISGKIEGENTMEKRLRVFRAHSRIFPWWSEDIELLKSLCAGIIDET